MKTFLRTLAVFVAASFTINASAQIPDNGVWPSGVTFTDINGVTHDIDAILDAGKPVFIDAFADWCGPCWTYHQGKALENLYNNYGPDGSDVLAVFGIESDPSTPASAITNPSSHQNSGDWSNGTSFPLANDDNLASIINQAYYPTIIMICPDRSVTEVGQKTTSALYAYIGTCGAPASSSNDPRLLENTSQEIFCSGQAANMSVALQNFGIDPLTEATIEVLEGSTVLSTTNWTGNLETYQVEEVNLGSVAPTSTTTYSIKISSNNDDTSNDEVSAIIAPAPVLEVGINSKEVTFELDVDFYTDEIGIIFDEGMLPSTDYVQIHNNAANGITNPLGFVQVGSYNTGASPITETWNVVNEGCHYAVFVDAYSDGYTFNKPNATIKIIGTGGSSVSVNPDFGDWTYTLFDVKFEDDLGINDEVFASSFKTYPNPTSEIVNIEFELLTQEDVTISIINTVGQTVSTKNLGKISGVQSTQMDVSNLESGMYIVKVRTANGEKTQRISVL